MSGTLFYLAVTACIVTLVVVMVGILGFGTGRASASFSNRMMRYRVIAQAIAIILIMATVWLVQSGN